MIIVIEYDPTFRPTIWTADNEDQFIRAVKTTYDAQPRSCSTFEAAARLNRTNVYEQEIFRSTLDAIKALDNPRMWRSQQAYEQVRSLVFKKPVNTTLVKVEDELMSAGCWSKEQQESLMGIFRLLKGRENEH